MLKELSEICNELEDYINTHHNRSALDRGINNYAIDFIDFLREEKPGLSSGMELERILLNGAETWRHLCKSNGVCLTIVGFVGFSPDCLHCLKFWCKWHAKLLG